MSVWIRNLRTSLEDRPVAILHGNVRDKYIDEHGRIYENLTELLQELGTAVENGFSEMIFYDLVGHERRFTKGGAKGEVTGQKATPARVLANWATELRTTGQNRLAVIYYLDKLVAYNTSYSDAEKETLLWLEKLIENITSNHRLVLVALQDTLVPIELYTHSPKTSVLTVPRPDRADRLAYLKHRLGERHAHLELIGDLADGLFLRDLDAIASAVNGAEQLNTREVRRVVNKYRIGEQEDHWGTLSIGRLNGGLKWFREVEGVKGQDEAIRKVVDMLCLARAGLSGVASGTGSKPKGVLFFAGPTGVGKTFVAKKLAKYLFSTEEAFLRLDMSEFKEEHTVSKLIGSPARRSSASSRNRWPSWCGATRTSSWRRTCRTAAWHGQAWGALRRLWRPPGSRPLSRSSRRTLPDGPPENCGRWRELPGSIRTRLNPSRRRWLRRSWTRLPRARLNECLERWVSRGTGKAVRRWCYTLLQPGVR